MKANFKITDELRHGNTVKAQLVRHIAVGAFTTAINFAIYAALYFSGVAYISASAAGYLCGVLANFVFSRRFTFKSTGEWQAELPKHFLSYAAALALNLALLYALVARAGVNPLLANAASICISTLAAFAVLKRFVFRQIR